MSASGDRDKDEKASTSYLAVLNPWGPRTGDSKQATGETSAASDQDRRRGEPISSEKHSIPQRGGDHSLNHRHRVSSSLYPPDCPKLSVRWFHAVDVAKHKPNYVNLKESQNKPPAAPKKWNAFSAGDSRAIEAAFQSAADEEERLQNEAKASEKVRSEPALQDQPNRSLDAAHHERNASKTVTVPVNEDYLFDVDIQKRELGPAYWVGPIYEVRRGSWFFVDGSIFKPCDENLATQLEEGYVKARPWRNVGSTERGVSETRAARLSTSKGSLKPQASDGSLSLKSKVVENVEDQASRTDAADAARNRAGSLMTQRLFGSYMNSIVTFQDATTAWLTTDDFLSRMSSTVYQRFAGGAHLSGTKVVRGYVEPKKKGKDGKRPASPSADKVTPGADKDDASKRKSAPASTAPTRPGTPPEPSEEDMARARQPESRVQTLERQMSNLAQSAAPEDPEAQDEEERRRQEREIADDYRDIFGDAQDREIEHLILVTHGIGQRLGARFEAFNFIHDVNEFRKTLKAVYGGSPDLQALNAEVEKLPKNCRVQVLPICWRHLLDFPQQGVRYNRRENDITDMKNEDDDEFPDLQAITVEGVPALRNIVADLALDVLLYQTPAYKEHISRIVVKECNRIFKLFKQRNPNFDGKVSVVGHSLGSAILFDILSAQAKAVPEFAKTGKRNVPRSERRMRLDFDVEDFFCLGSPIGLFSLLNGKSIAGRKNPNTVTLDGSSGEADDDDNAATQGGPFSRLPTDSMSEAQREAMISSPKCRQLFNIFHPSDPIGYRIEPLISSEMSSLKPQPLPYTKRAFFGAPMGQGITGIPAKVGQSFSDIWSNFSSGLASSFITRSIGLTAEDAARLSVPPEPRANYLVQNSSPGAGTNAVAGGALPAGVVANQQSLRAEDLKSGRLDLTGTEGAHPPTALDAELETLYSGFQKRRRSRQESDSSSRDFGESPAWQEAEDRGRKLRREEAKVRALNENGRVDYSIQEGAFDISFFAAVASHLAYWTDADVSHFMISQLLSKQRVIRKTRSKSKVAAA